MQLLLSVFQDRYAIYGTGKEVCEIILENYDLIVGKESL